jgi:sec-independent protein translocase protein TatA
MNRVGFTEFLLILAIVVVIFGANRLPELGRGIGRGIRSFKESLRESANDKS